MDCMGPCTTQFPGALTIEPAHVRISHIRVLCMIFPFLTYADGLVILSPYSAGLQQLLGVGVSYGAQYISFNPLW